MGGSKSNNSQAVDFEKEQAAKAEKKEKERQGRLDQGKTFIDQIFNGSPVMEQISKAYDWGGFKAPGGQLTLDPTTGKAVSPPGQGIPEGYTAVQVANPKAGKAAGGGGVKAASRAGGSHLENVGSYKTLGNPKNLDSWAMVPNQTGTTRAVDPNAGMVWALKGPDGQLHYQGDAFNYNAQHDTGKKTGGFDPIVDKYGQDYLDLFNPEEQRQHDMASRDLGYNLARAGLRRSSVAADKQGELAYQDQFQKGKIIADASTAKGEFRKQIDQQKQAVINQLYSTEDPSLAQNLASSSAKGLQLQNPMMTPGTAFFDPAISAVGGALSAYTSPYSNKYGSPGGPTVAPAGSSSGKGYR